jgi:hypothetical protein
MEKNPQIFEVLLAKYPSGHPYWIYLDGVVGYLISRKCDGIQEKFQDVGNNNTHKFESAVSELRVARFLALRGKQVKLLQDTYLSGKSPDILVKDTLGESYVEVTRFSDDETINSIFEMLSEYLRDSSVPYRIDASLSADLSAPAVGYRERKAKSKKVRWVLDEFTRTMHSVNVPVPPADLMIEGVRFSISRSPIERGFVGTISTGGVTLPLGGFSQRIRYLVADSRFGKAAKRETWDGDYRLRYYIIAIDIDQPFFDEESGLVALLGSRTHYSFTPPKTKVPLAVERAAAKNWRGYLESVHLIPKEQSIYTSYGSFLTDSICKNVSGVLLHMRSDKALFVPNPFAYDEINSSKLVGAYVESL